MTHGVEELVVILLVALMGSQQKSVNIGWVQLQQRATHMYTYRALVYSTSWSWTFKFESHIVIKTVKDYHLSTDLAVFSSGECDWENRWLSTAGWTVNTVVCKALKITQIGSDTKSPVPHRPPPHHWFIRWIAEFTSFPSDSNPLTVS